MVNIYFKYIIITYTLLQYISVFYVLYVRTYIITANNNNNNNNNQ
jgi:hypothetical protein